MTSTLLLAGVLAWVQGIFEASADFGNMSPHGVIALSI
ncbi:hypothetical protein [Sporisorium scitamineum]|uniref:Uncharacterized protein n=1 Tax=Sporisorium scitamineum TaxID=49012 RepID=A0A0F7S3F7_9BASI|nr:hypothetical protein [Sporisorium scitamineum]